MKPQVVIHGASQLSAKLKLSIAANEQKLLRGLITGGRLLQADSQREVPVDTATLKRSADTIVHKRGSKPEVWVIYSTDYAIYVHENLNAAHRAPTKAKFLEDPAKTNRKKYVDAVVKAANVTSSK